MKREWAWVVGNTDWPTGIPDVELTKDELYGVLARIPEVFDAAMCEDSETEKR